MKVKDYISQRLQTFGVTMSEAELLDVCLSAGIDGGDEVESGNYVRVNIGLASVIPMLLMRATSVSESGFSMSWNVEGMKEYYAFLCRKYGLTDELNTDKPKVRFL